MASCAAPHTPRTIRQRLNHKPRLVHQHGRQRRRDGGSARGEQHTHGAGIGVVSADVETWCEHRISRADGDTAARGASGQAWERVRPALGTRVGRGVDCGTGTRTGRGRALGGE